MCRKKNIRAADKLSKSRKNLRLIRKRLTAVVINSVIEASYIASFSTLRN